MCPRLFTATLMICLLLASSSKSQDNVIVRKVDNSYIFIFPSTQGRIKANSNPAGRIDLGDTITVKYAFKIIRSGRSRFILIDATNGTRITPKLTVEQATELFGFMLKDLNNPNLEIHIDPSFMEKVQAKDKLTSLRREVVRQGNLDVIIEKKDNVYRIKEARLN